MTTKDIVKVEKAIKNQNDDEESSSEEDPENLQYKIVVLGNGTVGKTSLIMRFCEDYFARSYKQTIGVDFFVKRIELPGDVHVTLQVWDIGGQSIFSKMIQTYVYEANAVLYTYDITNQQSFQDLEDWQELVAKSFAGRELPHQVLLGNKVDLNHMQAVKQDLHTQFSTSNKMSAFYVSAKTGDQVNSVFYQLSADLAGVELSKPALEIAQKTVKAEIIKEKQDDQDDGLRAEHKLDKQIKKEKKTSTCSIF